MFFGGFGLFGRVFIVFFDWFVDVFFSLLGRGVGRFGVPFFGFLEVFGRFGKCWELVKLTPQTSASL